MTGLAQSDWDDLEEARAQARAADRDAFYGDPDYEGDVREEYRREAVADALAGEAA